MRIPNFKLNLVLQVVTIAADLSKDEAPAQIVKEAVDKLGGDLLASRTWTDDHNYQILGIALYCLLGLDVLKNKPIVNKSKETEYVCGEVG